MNHRVFCSTHAGVLCFFLLVAVCFQLPQPTFASPRAGAGGPVMRDPKRWDQQSVNRLAAYGVRSPQDGRNWGPNSKRARRVNVPNSERARKVNVPNSARARRVSVPNSARARKGDVPRRKNGRLRQRATVLALLMGLGLADLAPQQIVDGLQGRRAQAADTAFRDSWIVEDEVDMTEVNHFYDEQGGHVFDQVIYYDWCNVANRYQVVAWRLQKSPSQVPTQDPETKKYIATWHDGTVMRGVKATSYRESWTQYDPELVERDFLPKEWRQDLSSGTPIGLLQIGQPEEKREELEPPRIHVEP